MRFNAFCVSALDFNPMLARRETLAQHNRSNMSFWRLYYHLVWTTKNREPLIQPAIEDRLHVLLMHKAEELGVWIYAMDGWYDHIHLVVAIPPKHTVANVVKHLKGESAHALNHAGLGISFGWQRGYGVLSVGERHRPQAERYVRQQKEHHRSGNTVGVLEYCSELEDGPDTEPLSTEHGLREDEARYGVGSDPFWLDDDGPVERA